MVEKLSGERPVQLNLKTLPSIRVQYLWNWFWQLDGYREAGLPISHQELLAWTQLYGIKPSRFELAALKQMDYTSINTRRELFRSPLDG